MKRCRWTLLGTLLSVLLLLSLGGCQKAQDVETTTVSADKKGKIEQMIVEPLGSDDYTAEELEAYISDSLAAYTEEAGSENIKLESCEMKEGTVKIRISYESWSDYMGFNQVACFFGTLEEAQEAGYSFDRNFLDNSGKAAAGATILAHGQEWKILILEEPVQVMVPGTVLYTTDNVSVTGTRTASIGGSTPESIAGQFVATTDEAAYIIFKP